MQTLNETETKKSSAAPEEAQVPDKIQLPKTQRHLNKWVLIVSALSILGATAVFSAPMIKELLSCEDTDDAYITGHLHTVSPRVAGTIEKVFITDNQRVAKGQLLALLDQKDYLVAVRKAAAHLEKVENDALATKKMIGSANKTASAAEQNSAANIASASSVIAKSQDLINEYKFGIASAKQVLNQRDAELLKAQLDLARYTGLEKKGAVTTERLNSAQRDAAVAIAAKEVAIDAVDQAAARLKQAYSELAAAHAQMDSAKATTAQAEASNLQVGIDEQQHLSTKSTVTEAEADLKDAELKLSYTEIKAPVSGRVGRKAVEEGQRVQTGTPLLSIVSLDKWIIANFKETQLGDMKPGQQASVKIDSFPKHEFKGLVDSFAPASGAEFALLPPDNATGNFTKVVQRLPVKILLDMESLGNYRDLIAPGMSCVIKVKVRN